MFRSAYTYDANGNILTADRWNKSGTTQYDQLSYKYEGSDPLDGTEKTLRNRLYELFDDGTDMTDDIHADNDPSPTDPLIFGTQVNTSTNYRYDPLGNLVHDELEGIENISWTVTGKVKSVERTSGSPLDALHFGYGASGHRIMKKVTDDPDLGEGYREHYIRDAQGNIMATYRYSNTAGPGVSLRLKEWPIYGSSRVGQYIRGPELYGEDLLTPPTTAPMGSVEPMHPGHTHYELNDHLGNVSAVVTGQLLPGGAASAWQPRLLSAQGYEPGGSLLPGRNYSSSTYAHGFNGMRKDDEIHGATGTSYDFGARLYDPRVGRWLSLDPLAKKYPDLSPYCFVGNNPIAFVDPNGKEIVIHYGDNQSYTYGSNQPVPDDAFVMETVLALNHLIANAQDPERIVESMAISNQFTWSIGQGNATQGANDVYTIPFGAMNTAFTTCDPRAGVRTTSGGVQSPATQLLHEGGHAWLASMRSEIIRAASKLASAAETAEDSQRILDDATRTLNAIDMLMNTPIGEWDEIEERYVIEKFETPFARSQGEAVRDNHRGSFFRTDSPTSTTPQPSPVERERPVGVPYADEQ